MLFLILYWYFLLFQATQKFPVGTRDRWEKIAQMVSTVGKRTAKEVVKKIKEQELEQLENRRMGKSEAFDQFTKVNHFMLFSS